MNRQVLKSNFTSPYKCLDCINYLDGMFYREFNKNANSSLYFSSSGTDKNPIYEITIYWEDKDKKEYEYFKNLASSIDINKS